MGEETEQEKLMKTKGYKNGQKKADKVLQNALNDEAEKEDKKEIHDPIGLSYSGYYFTVQKILNEIDKDHKAHAGALVNDLLQMLLYTFAMNGLKADIDNIRTKIKISSQLRDYIKDTMGADN